MSKIIPLNNNTHRTLTVTESTDFSGFSNQQLIPIVVHDFVQLASEFPIVFVKNSETGQFIPVAMMGIKQGVNLYCQTTTWPCTVIPSGFKNAPFSLMQKTENSEEVIVCIDEESPLVNQTNGQALFDEQGEQSQYLQDRSKALLTVAEMTQQTQIITNFFAEKKLFSNRQLTVKLGPDNQPFTIDGIYLISETALNELSTESFEALRTKGLLPVIYSHLTSIHQVSRLTKMQNSYDLQQ